jgi:hypothetical protein
MSRAHEILKFFEDVPKTESAFYLRFQSMNIEDIEFLKSFYKETEQWRVFCKICSFFNVKVA